MADQGCVIDQIPVWAAEALSYRVTGETMDSTAQPPFAEGAGVRKPTSPSSGPALLPRA